MNPDPITWSDDYSIGNETVDAQHQQLVVLANSLFKSIQRGTGQADMAKCFDELVAYTNYHFESEEALMIKNHYPLYNAHKKIHRMFVEKVVGLRDTFLSGDKFITYDVYTYLKEWILNHIAVEDKKLEKYL